MAQTIDLIWPGSTGSPSISPLITEELANEVKWTGTPAVGRPRTGIECSPGRNTSSYSGLLPVRGSAGVHSPAGVSLARGVPLKGWGTVIGGTVMRKS